MSGFPPELRPLLALVIVLAIVHMLLKARARRAKARTRRVRSRSTRHPGSPAYASVADAGPRAAATGEPDASIDTSDATSSVDPASTDPAEALRELRVRAAEMTPRSKDPTS